MHVFYDENRRVRIKRYIHNGQDKNVSQLKMYWIRAYCWYFNCGVILAEVKTSYGENSFGRAFMDVDYDFPIDGDGKNAISSYIQEFAQSKRTISRRNDSFHKFTLYLIGGIPEIASSPGKTSQASK